MVELAISSYSHGNYQVKTIYFREAIYYLRLLTFFSCALSHRHLFYQPVYSVPDAETQRQHDSWSAQRGFLELPGINTDSQDARYNSYNLWNNHLFIRSLRSFPHLKNGSFFGAISTCTPVLGFLPAYQCNNGSKYRDLICWLAKARSIGGSLNMTPKTAARAL